MTTVSRALQHYSINVYVYNFHILALASAGQHSRFTPSLMAFGKISEVLTWLLSSSAT